MAYFELDEGKQVNHAHFTATIFMAGIVGVATWELWGRHIAPFLFGNELSPASVIQILLHIEGRLTAESIYFATAIPAISLGYLFLWRPALRMVSKLNHWVFHGFSYGVVLFFLAGLLMISVNAMPPDIRLGGPLFAGWFFGIMLSAISTAGFVRLRELGQKVLY